MHSESSSESWAEVEEDPDLLWLYQNYDLVANFFLLLLSLPGGTRSMGSLFCTCSTFYSLSLQFLHRTMFDFFLTIDSIPHPVSLVGSTKIFAFEALFSVRLPFHPRMFVIYLSVCMNIFRTDYRSKYRKAIQKVHDRDVAIQQKDEQIKNLFDEKEAQSILNSRHLPKKSGGCAYRGCKDRRRQNTTKYWGYCIIHFELLKHEIARLQLED